MALQQKQRHTREETLRLMLGWMNESDDEKREMKNRWIWILNFNLVNMNVFLYTFEYNKNALRIFITPPDEL